MLKADWTKKDAVIANELGKYGRTGIPLNVFLKTGQPPAILSEALTGTEVLSALSAVSAGKPYQAETTTHSFFIWMLLAFGGGGPMHATGLADLYGLQEIIVPAASSAFSALGCLTADFAFLQQRTVRRIVWRNALVPVITFIGTEITGRVRRVLNRPMAMIPRRGRD